MSQLFRNKNWGRRPRSCGRLRFARCQCPRGTGLRLRDRRISCSWWKGQFALLQKLHNDSDTRGTGVFLSAQGVKGRPVGSIVLNVNTGVLPAELGDAMGVGVALVVHLAQPPVVLKGAIDGFVGMIVVFGGGSEIIVLLHAD